MDAELYAREESLVKKTGPWIDGSVFKKAKVSFVADNQYYHNASLELGTFEIDITDALYWAEQTGVMSYTQAYPIGTGNAEKGDKCVYVDINVDSSYKKIKISCPDSLFILRVVMEK